MILNTRGKLVSQSHELTSTGKILYAEDSLKGHSIVIENTQNEDSKVNLEHLFNAVTENAEITKSLFQY